VKNADHKVTLATNYIIILLYRYFWLKLCPATPTHVITSNYVIFLKFLSVLTCACECHVRCFITL